MLFQCWLLCACVAGGNVLDNQDGLRLDNQDGGVNTIIAKQIEKTTRHNKSNVTED